METGKLSSHLRAGREDAGLSLEAVAQRTKIPRRLLEALEQDRFDALPPPVFVKGFVRSYCGAVGLDAEYAIELLVERYAGGPLAPVVSVVAATPVATASPIYLTPPQMTEHRGLRISHLVLVLVAIALFVAAYLIVGSREEELGRSTAATEPSPSERAQPVAPDLDARFRVTE